MLDALEATRRNVARAAARLGITRNTLRYRIAKTTSRPHPDAPARSPLAAPPRRPAVPAPSTARWESRRVALFRQSAGRTGEEEGAADPGRVVDASWTRCGASAGNWWSWISGMCPRLRTLAAGRRALAGGARGARDSDRARPRAGSGHAGGAAGDPHRDRAGGSRWGESVAVDAERRQGERSSKGWRSGWSRAGDRGSARARVSPRRFALEIRPGPTGRHPAYRLLAYHRRLRRGGPRPSWGGRASCALVGCSSRPGRDMGAR